MLTLHSCFTGLPYEHTRNLTHTQVQHVRGQIEVVPLRLHKGVIAKTILRSVLKTTGGYPDFVLCVGDDVSDEHMFTRYVSACDQ